MSLINQMLKDLEKRSPSQGAQAGAGPSAVASSGRSRRPRRVVWGGLTLALLVAGAGLWTAHTFGGRGGVQSAPEEPVASSPARPVHPEPLQLVLPVAKPAPPTDEPRENPALLQAVRLLPQAGGLQVEIALSRVTAYRLVRGEQGRQLVLELPGGGQVAALPETAGLPLLENLSKDAGAAGTRLVFALKDACRYEALSLSENPDGPGQVLGFTLIAEPAPPDAVVAQAPPQSLSPPVREADATPASATAARPEPAVAPEAGLVRQAVSLTPRQRAANLCRDGIAALQEGRLPEAEAALRGALAVEPGHMIARDMLLRLLASQQRTADMRTELAAGLREAPGHLPYRLRYARLLIEEGALPEAHEQLLRRPRPAIADAPDLYAMLATLYQRRGQYAEAAQTYRALLAVRPQQALWWMGLGIALEGTSSMEPARQAYRQALDRGGLSAGLQDYIRQRLAVLDRAAGQAPAAAMSAGREAT